MNKTAIKNFSIWARNKLIADVSYKAGLMGISSSGIAKPLPQSTGATEFYDIGTKEPYAISGEAVRQRCVLVDALERKAREADYATAYKYVLEEVAYTWFNRLIAIRFMEVNDYLPSHLRVLSSDSGKMEPDLVTRPFDAELNFTNAEKETISRLKLGNAIDELFQMLFIKQCNALNTILPGLFEKTNDYTELLLSVSVIDRDGVVYHLVHDIPEEDFDVKRGGQVEIIGWLYQYYNTEPKNEAFAKTGKITKDEIPAVTQLFTPDWIVRYMVENSLGRIFIDRRKNEGIYADGRNPAEMTWDEIEEKRIANEESIAQDMGWRYYLPEAKQEPEVAAQLEKIQEEHALLEPQDIKVIDPCMGSGHILVYAFDVLMQIYENAGWTQRDAAKSIIENNLYGLDIDDRAYQLAYFALLMKARQYNKRVLSGKALSNVYAIKESNLISRESIRYFGTSLSELERNSAFTQINDLLDAFVDAKEYGSILNVESYNWELLYRFVDSLDFEGQLSFDSSNLDSTKQALIALLKIGETISRKYDVAITNPPYMGGGGMDEKLSTYAKKHYPNSKSDLSTIFMEKALSMAKQSGYVSMINIPVWMFLTTYEKLRKNFLTHATIVNMIHPGRGIFGSDFGTTTFVLRRGYIQHYVGSYRRLFEKQGDVESIEERERVFLSGSGAYYSCQDNFLKIPSASIAYWASSAFLKAFDFDNLGSICDLSEGIHSRNNDDFLRLWHEVCANKSALFRYTENAKWYPCNKGGLFRKWYGNNDYVIDWENDGYNIKNYPKASTGSSRHRFEEGITFTTITSAERTFRYSPQGFLYDMAGPTFFLNDPTWTYYVLALFSSKLGYHFLSAINPGVSLKLGEVKSFPVLLDESKKIRINQIARNCVEICKEDWDSFESSWNYEIHPIVKKGLSRIHWNTEDATIEECYHAWRMECDERFSRLKANEEEINSVFIKLYGLENELIPEIEDGAVTVRRADKQREIRSLLSYAVGCMFGRYALKSSGLAYAGGQWDIQRFGQFKPDSDNVIPLTDEEYLDDDVVARLCAFLKIAFGEKTLEENLDYIASALESRGRSSRDIIRSYFLNAFFEDHCQVYGKRPIYWLFDSGKQNGFKALIYLHRYNADTIGNLRVDYLHKMQRVYESEIGRMQDTIDHSSNSREVAAASKRKEKLQKQLKECREYDEKIGHLALSRIELDLDDGVKTNYRKLQTAQDGKFYEVLAKSKDIMAKEK